MPSDLSEQEITAALERITASESFSNTPGARTLHEMEVLRRAGLSPSYVLTATTRNAAEALGIIDEVGTITSGKIADLVILDGNPMQDFSALRRPVTVLKSGRVVHGSIPDQR